MRKSNFCAPFYNSLENSDHVIALPERYGPLRSVWIARKPPGFAFIEYEDMRDAEDAVRKMDGAQPQLLEHQSCRAAQLLTG